MSEFSDELSAITLELITEYGEAITFTRITVGAYDASTGSTGSGSTAMFTGVGVPIDYIQSEIDGTIVKQSDVKLFVNAVATVPVVGDEVDLDSQDYKVMDVTKFAVNSETVLYELQLRV